MAAAAAVVRPETSDGRPRDPGNLVSGLSIMPDVSIPRILLARPFVRSSSGEAGDHAGMGGAGHGADDDRVEEDTELPFLFRDS
jgi:hypothetical protein